MKTMNWTQTAWDQKTKRAYAWKGDRSDGRSFRIFFFNHTGYVVQTFNGHKIGKGSSLADAQKAALEHSVCIPVRVAK